MCSLELIARGRGELGVSIRRGTLSIRMQGMDLHGTVFGARSSSTACRLYTVEYYVGIAGDSTP